MLSASERRGWCKLSLASGVFLRLTVKACEFAEHFPFFSQRGRVCTAEFRVCVFEDFVYFIF